MANEKDAPVQVKKVHPQTDRVESGQEKKLSEMTPEEQKKLTPEERLRMEEAEKAEAKAKAEAASKATTEGGKALATSQLASFMSNALASIMAALSNVASLATGFFAGLWGGIVGVAQTLWTGIGTAATWVGGLFGLTGTSATAVGAATLVGVTGALGIVGPILLQDNPALHEERVINCEDLFNQAATKFTTAKAYDEQQKESAQKLYSVFYEWGLTDLQIAGILGNFEVESNLDPSSVEGVFTEFFEVGPKKKWAIENHDEYTRNELFNGSYAHRSDIAYEQYRGTNGYWPGMGLAQFTPGSRLVDPALTLNRDWYDMDYQLAWIVAFGTEVTTGSKGGRAFWENYHNETMGQGIEAVTEYFLVHYLGGRPTDLLGFPTRVRNAKAWYSLIQDGTIKYDINYAEGVLGLAQELGDVAINSTVKKQIDDCRRLMRYDNSTMAKAAASYAYAQASEGIGNNGTALWQRVFDDIWGPGASRVLYKSCDTAVSTAVRWSGSDIDYPISFCPTQHDYLKSSPKWKSVGMMPNLTIDDLEPGDIGIHAKHTWMYVGEEVLEEIHGASYVPGNNTVSASYMERSPGAGSDATYYFSLGGGDYYDGVFMPYEIFRLVQPDNSDKYKSAGAGTALPH